MSEPNVLSTTLEGRQPSRTRRATAAFLTATVVATGAGALVSGCAKVADVEAGGAVIAGKDAVKGDLRAGATLVA